MKRIFAAFLTLLMLLSILPMSVFAESYKESESYIRTQMNNSIPQQENSGSSIVAELPEQRDEYKKVFRKEDGSFTALVSAEPIHYFEEGQWKEIDNSLTEKTENGKKVFENTGNDFQIRLPETISEQNGVAVSSRGFTLEFSLQNIDTVQAELKSNDPVRESNDPVLPQLSKQTSAVAYKNIAEGTDVEYILSSSILKENIVIKKRSAVQETYTFLVKCDGLSGQKNSNGSIDFIDGGGNTIYTVPAPFMIDSREARCDDIKVHLLQNGDGKYTLEYTPSSAWLKDPQRKFPVVIDPIVYTQRESWIEDTFVKENFNTACADSEALSIMGDRDENGNVIDRCEAIVKIHPEWFGLNSDTVVPTEVQLCFSGYIQGDLAVYENTENTNIDTVLWSNKPSHASIPTDYYTARGNTALMELCHFNITSIFNQWLYGDKANYGLTLRGIGDAFAKTILYASDHTSSSYKPFILIDYIDKKGYDPDAAYHSQNMGRAGTASVGDFTRSTNVLRSDLSLGGNVAPVNVGFLYNSAFFSKGGDFSPLACLGLGGTPPSVYGENWITTYNRMLFFSCDATAAVGYLTQTGNILYFYARDDEDGNCIYEESNGGHSGYKMEVVLPDGSSDYNLNYYKVTDPQGNTEHFDTFGRLVTIQNEKQPEQTVQVAYVSNLSDDANFLAIDNITDGTGRKYQFTYAAATGLLESIRCLNREGQAITAGGSQLPLAVNYGYTDGNLTSVTFPDSACVQYEYTADGCLSSLTDVNGYRLSYTYNNSKKVTSINEFARDADGTFVPGNALSIVADSPHQVKFTDRAGSVRIEQFDALGNLKSTMDGKGRFTFRPDNSREENSTASRSSDVRASSNLLLNGSFENGSEHWTDLFGNNNTTTDNHPNQAVFGKATADLSHRDLVLQEVDAPGAADYTLSAYVKSPDLLAVKAVDLRITALDESGNYLTSQQVNAYSCQNNWQRYETSLSAPENTARIQVVLNNSQDTTYYIDGVQLKKTDAASSYNQLENGAFADGTSGWSAQGDDGAEIVQSTVNGIQTTALSVNGAKNMQRIQTVPIAGKKGDVFSLSGWMKAYFVANNSEGNLFERGDVHVTPNFQNNRVAQLRAFYEYTEDGTTKTETAVLNYSQFVSDWQFGARDFTLKGNCDSITIAICYENNLAPAAFADLALTKSNYSGTQDGEETASCPCGDRCEGGDSCSCTCASANDCNCDSCKSCICKSCEQADCPCRCESEETCTCESCKTCVCEGCQEFGCPCRCESEETCDCTQCKRGTASTYDAYGNTTSTTRSDGVTALFSSASFSANGNYLTSKHDENGKTTQYTYNLDNGLLESLKEGSGNTLNYAYDAMNHLTALSVDLAAATGETQTVTTAYSYNNDRLTQISRGGVNYTIAYDIWGQMKKISVAGQPLYTYSYDSGAYRGRILSIAYANGDTAQYVYTEDGAVSAVKINGETAYEYTYTAAGALKKITDHLSGQVIQYNKTKMTVSEVNSRTVIYTAQINAAGELEETFGGSTFTTKTYDGDYDHETGFSISKTGIKSMNTESTSTLTEDYFSRRIKEETEAFTTDYAYAPAGENRTTGRVSEIRRTTATATYLSADSFAYDYDENGNVTAEYALAQDGAKTLRYRCAYDDMGQLVRCDDALNNNSSVYTYDSVGNILSKTDYAFTTDNLGEPVKTTDYAYDANWKDQLISFGGRAITYDALGNPTTIGSAVLTWNGRNLLSYEDGNKRTEYTYDQQGMRTGKTLLIDNVRREAYRYYWQNGKLISQTRTYFSADGTKGGEIATKYLYDAAGQPVGFITTNNQQYYYAKNLQGDITGVYNRSGKKIAVYTYDAWGNTTVSMAHNQTAARDFSSVKSANAFGWRGYCFDTDTGLYYLQSRYYAPQMSRFLNTDTVLDTGSGVLGSNVYAYCNNNPVMYIDPTGQYSVWNDLSGGWKYRIDKATPFVKRHIHVEKDGESYSQNDDGSPHDGTTGSPPNSIKKELKKNGTWDWDKNAEEYEKEQSGSNVSITIPEQILSAFSSSNILEVVLYAFVIGSVFVLLGFLFIPLLLLPA